MDNSNTPNQAVGVRKDLIPALQIEALRESRSLAAHVSHILRRHLEEQGALDTDMARG